MSSPPVITKPATEPSAVIAIAGSTGGSTIGTRPTDDSALVYASFTRTRPRSRNNSVVAVTITQGAFIDAPAFGCVKTDTHRIVHSIVTPSHQSWFSTAFAVHSTSS